MLNALRVRRPLLPYALAVVLMPVAAGQAVAQQQESGRPVVRIGVLFDGPSERLQATPGQLESWKVFELTRDEILSRTASRLDVLFPDTAQVSADWSVGWIKAGLDTLLSDPGVDLVLAMGIYSTHEACTRVDLPKPVIAPFGIDAELQGFPRDGEASGVRNLSYLSLPHRVGRDIRIFRDLIDFERIHVIHDPMFVEYAPGSIESLGPGIADLGVEVIPLPVTGSADDVLRKLPADAQAVYVTILPRLSTKEMDLVIDGLRERRLPSFSMFGMIDVERGILAGVAPAPNLTRFAGVIAERARQILSGVDAGTLPVTLERPERLSINMKTATAIGWKPKKAVLRKAVLVE